MALDKTNKNIKNARNLSMWEKIVFLFIEQSNLILYHESDLTKLFNKKKKMS